MKKTEKIFVITFWIAWLIIAAYIVVKGILK